MYLIVDSIPPLMELWGTTSDELLDTIPLKMVFDGCIGQIRYTTHS